MGDKRVCVYRRPGCMFCSQVETMLAEDRVPFDSIEIDDKGEQERMSQRHGALSFPLVMVDEQYVGGFTHMVQLHAEGRLRASLLGEAEPTNVAPRSKPPAVGSLAGYAALGKLLAQRKKERHDPDG